MKVHVYRNIINQCFAIKVAMYVILWKNTKQKKPEHVSLQISTKCTYTIYMFDHYHKITNNKRGSCTRYIKLHI